MTSRATEGSSGSSSPTAPTSLGDIVEGVVLLGVHNPVEAQGLYVWLEAREPRDRSPGLHLRTHWKGPEFLLTGPGKLDTETYDFELPIFRLAHWKDNIPLLNLAPTAALWDVHAELRTDDCRTRMSAESRIDVAWQR